MADQKLNPQIEEALPDAKRSGGGSNSDRLSRSPLAIREGNADPEHYDGGGSLGMDEPSKSDGINDDAWKLQGDRYVNKEWGGGA